jgi:hypothetical protein
MAGEILSMRAAPRTIRDTGWGDDVNALDMVVGEALSADAEVSCRRLEAAEDSA